MKYGIYYAYWEKQWGGDFRPYVERVARLGFDILEISCAALLHTPEHELTELRELAKHHGIELTAGYGPAAAHCIASADPAVVENALEFYAQTFAALEKLNIRFLGGGLYSYWPVDYTQPVDKQADWERSVKGMRRMADLAAAHGITLGMEALNRFEGYLINTSAEARAYVEQVGRENVTIMLDTFHMNIEEDSFSEAIRLAGDRLGHFHIGEANRRVPGQGRIPWREVGEALRAVGYNGAVVMEPFVLRGGQVGADIKIWRDLCDGTDATLDADAARALAFTRYVFENR